MSASSSTFIAPTLAQTSFMIPAQSAQEELYPI